MNMVSQTLTLTFLKEQVQSSKNLGEALRNRNNIGKEGAGNNVLKPESVNKVKQLALLSNFNCRVPNISCLYELRFSSILSLFNSE
jgi:hypothetical protein